MFEYSNASNENFSIEICPDKPQSVSSKAVPLYVIMPLDMDRAIISFIPWQEKNIFVDPDQLVNAIWLEVDSSAQSLSEYCN